MEHYDIDRLYVLLAVSSAITIASFGFVWWETSHPEWIYVQRRFKQKEVARLQKQLQEAEKEAQTNPAMKEAVQDFKEQIRQARRRKIEVKQFNIPQIGRVDRCMTCHLGILDDAYKVEKELVFRTHPEKEFFLGKNHPVEQFGCTVCHEGQGYGTFKKAAHGFVHHWEKPMLVGDYIQMSCGKCHDPKAPLEGAPVLVKGREVMKEKAVCLACHKLKEEGPQQQGTCPELSIEGSKAEHEYDYTNVDKKHRIHHNAVLSWHYEHFKDPNKVSTGTQMGAAVKGMGLTNEEIKALTIYVLSFRDVKLERLAAEYIPKAKAVKIVPIARFVQKPDTVHPPEFLAKGKQVFQTNCFQCHGTEGKGDGPAAAALTPKPADFTDSTWKYAAGEDGIYFVCSKGVPGTAMPPWESAIPDADRRAVAAYIWSLSRELRVEK